MEAIELVVKLKASGGENDFSDLGQCFDDYKKIVTKLPAKDRISFSLNVLCVICRNLDKVPSWRNVINIKDLAALSIDCIRETRPADRAERLKTLACICHIHKFIVRQGTSIPPELLLKLSYMPFEPTTENMLAEHSKTYWNILADRITYLERLKTEKRPIVKLLPKLIEDYDKVLKVCDSVKFCQLVLVFLVKKLYYLFSDNHAKELNNSYKDIFDGLTAKTDLKNFKKLSDTESMDIYVKFNECFYTIMENSSKTKFKDSVFYDIVRAAILMVGHNSDLFHCLQTFYLNTFCNLLTDKLNSTFTETILSGMIVSCEMTEKLSYKSSMMATYPYIYQLLRLYLEYTVNNGETKWKEYFTVEIQESCLKLVLFLMTKLKDTNQMLKCDNCTAKTGLHDSLRLSFPIKNIISVSLSQEMDLTAVLPVYSSIIEKQHEVLNKLGILGCRNHQKCLQKAQTDIHNTAILLHKAKNYDFSIKIFDVYLKREIALHKTDSDLKNISRGFYNKAICELDSKLHEESLQSAYLSYLFSQPEGLTSEKHISLVIDIKAKAIKGKDLNDSQDISQDHLQLMTVKDVFKKCLVTDPYGNLRRFFKDLRLSELLMHEFSMYEKLWPSIVPVAGVWVALYDMMEVGRCDDLPAEDPSSILTRTYDVILRTPYIVRTVHNDHFKKIVLALLDKIENVDKAANVDKVERMEKGRQVVIRENLQKFEKNLKRIQEGTREHVPQEMDRLVGEIDKKAGQVLKKPDKHEGKADKCEKNADRDDNSERNGETVLMHATLLFLKTEYDLAEASLKYGWKTSAPGSDPDLASSPRTIPQEHVALYPAARAVQVLTSGLPQLLLLPHTRVVSALRQWRPLMPLLLAAGRRAPALQLAHVICELADRHNDSESYISAAGALLSCALRRTDALERILARAGKYAESMLSDGASLEPAIVFVCEASIYSAACGSPGAAAKLIQFAQARILQATETQPGLDLELAIGRLLDAQTAVCAGAGPGAAVWAQRHYLGLANTASQWSPRRLRSLSTKLRSTEAGLRAAGRYRALLLWRRARSACCAALQHAAAVDAARLLATVTCVHKTDEAQVKIDNRLKYILGLQPTNETHSHRPITDHKPNATPMTRTEPLETMLDAQMFKRTQLSPSVPCITVPAFKMPQFMSHGEDCTCYACQTPFCFVLACQTAGLEASVYFRAKEFDIAKHYYDGVFKMCGLAEQKLRQIVNGYKKTGFQDYVLDIVETFYRREFQRVQVEILIEASFFELSQKNYQRADEFIVRIHEIVQETDIDQYLQNEVMNLMCASAYMRKIIKSPDSDETGLESELENLKLSPTSARKPTDLQKTPETKAEKPPRVTRTKVVVKDEELPNLKRKIIKLNLDDAEESSTSSASAKPAARKTRFKIPVPTTSKPVPETITPVPKAKTKPKILVTQSTVDLPSAEDLATPMPKQVPAKTVETPLETQINDDLFFTPMTSVKTYQKKSLRKDIVKNLDKEFSTPIAEEDNAARPQRARRKVESGTLRSLRRSTSPGNLDEDPLNKRFERPSELLSRNSYVSGESKKK